MTETNQEKTALTSNDLPVLPSFTAKVDEKGQLLISTGNPNMDGLALLGLATAARDYIQAHISPGNTPYLLKLLQGTAEIAEALTLMNQRLDKLEAQPCK
jgi:hypothetical protein